jgi:hypothetical protein
MTNARDKANIPVLNFQSKGIDDNATSTAVTILSDGKIGIGTVNPVRELHVDGSTSSIAIGKNGSGSATLRFYSDGSQKSYIQLDPSENMVYYAPSGTDQQFYAGGSERMRLTSTGLGIGSSAPSAGLEVSNSSGIKISRSGYSQYMQLYPANNNVPTILGLGGNGIHIGTTTSTGIHVDGSDNVLINTTSASGFDSAGLPLIVGSGSTHQGITIFSGTSHQGAIHFADGTGTSSYRGQLNYKHDADAMTFAVTGSEKMRLNSTGLGIGSSAPSRPLHIVSSDNQLARFESTDTYGGIELCDNASGTAKPLISAVANDFVFYRGGSSHTVAFGATSVGFGVATASPSRALTVSGSTAPILALVETGTSGSSSVFFGDSGADNIGKIQYLHSSNDLAFTVNASERMRITSNGNVLFSTTSTPNTVVGSSGAGMAYEANGFLGIARIGATLILNRRNTHGDNAVFRYDGNTTGSISVTSNTTAYNTSSDYRLKENVSYDFDATTRLKQLKPARFNFISDADKTVDGFLAHEVSSIVPEAINGTKDAVDEDGNPEYQGIDQSKLVPLLVKTIQELEARITTLEANNP